jgi:perosamine synthetase
MSKIPFFKTYISKHALNKVKSTIKSTFLNEGKIVKNFETEIGNFLNLKNINTTSSGTSAIHLALACLKLKKGDEVILTPQTFIASGLAILYVGASPIFCDIDLETGNISIESLKKKISKNTKAIIAVHWSGYPCDMSKLKRVCKFQDRKITLIEDAAHAFGAKYNGKTIGSISDFTCFSFQSTKHLTTGDGGAVVSKSKKNHEKIRRLKWFGIDRYKDKPNYLGERQYNTKTISYKYHMNDFAASLGIENLKIMKKILNYHNKIGKLYSKYLGNIPGIKLMNYDKKNFHSYWFYQLMVKNRKRFIKKIRSLGYPCVVVNQRIDRNLIFKHKTILPNLDYFYKHQIGLPVNTSINEKDIKLISKSLKNGW